MRTIFSICVGMFWAASTAMAQVSSSEISSIFQYKNIVYVGTDRGLYISNTSFEDPVQRTTADGLGSNRIRKIFSDGKLLYVATVEGISVSSDGGKTFRNWTPGNYLYENIAFQVSEGVIYACIDGRFYRSLNEGKDYSKLALPRRIGRAQCGVGGFAITDSVLYMNSGAALFRSIDRGETYEHLFDIEPALTVSAKGQNLYLAKGGPVLSISRDQGGTFKTYEFEIPRLDIWGIKVDESNDNIFVGTFTSGYFMSRDGGNSFVSLMDAYAATTGLYSNGANIYFKAWKPGYPKESYGLHISRDGGKTWNVYQSLF